SPPGVLIVTSHLPPMPATLDVAFDVVAAGAVVSGAVVVAAADDSALRFAVQSPSPKPPNSALPSIVASITLPVIVISSGVRFIVISISLPSSGTDHDTLI